MAWLTGELLRPRRVVRSVFVEPWPYWTINVVRHWGLDIAVIATGAAAGLWWVRGPGGLDLGLTDDDSADELLRTLLVHHVTRYYPTLVAMVLCVLLLRVGRRFTNPGTSAQPPGAVYVSLTVGSVVLVAALPLLDAFFVPGSAVQRLAPCAAGAALAIIARLALYGGVRRQAVTEAGFLPPRRILLWPRTRRLVRRCSGMAWGTQSAADTARARFAAARDAFARHRSGAGVAWCVAAEVDYHLKANALDTAEELLAVTVTGAASRNSVQQAHPAVIAADALFLQSVGDRDGAAVRFAEAREALRTAGRRVPSRLAVLCTTAGTPGQAGPVDLDGLGFRQLARMVWLRQPSLVLQHLLARVRRLAVTDPDAALLVAERMCWLAGRLPQPAYFSDLTGPESSLVVKARAEFHLLDGEINAALGRGADAVNGCLAAARLYQSRRFRAREGVALVRAALAALATAPQSARRESTQLDLLLRGLRMLEYDRGLLRTARHRFALAEDRDRLYSDVFAGLSADVRGETARAAEIALWLMESLHRSATAATIRRGLDTTGESELIHRYEQVEAATAYDAEFPMAATETSGNGDEDGDSRERWLDLRRDIASVFSQRLADALVPEPVDLAGIEERLAGRLALYYRCERVVAAWDITVVALLPTGPSLTRSTLTVPDAGHLDHSFRRSAALLLDQLHTGDEKAVATIHRTVVLSARVWRELARALFPPQLEEALRTAGTASRPPVVVIVPDGPLSAVPFAGLPLGEDAPLIDRAVPVFMPNLDILAGDDDPEHDPAADARVLVNIGQPGFAHAFARARAEDPLPGRVIVTDTEGRKEFVDALPDLDRDDVALVFNHGLLSDGTWDHHVRMNDGRILSATTAWNLPWPRTVILGSCWSTSLTLTTSAEPLSMATACLLGGADNVLGSQAKAYPKEVGRLLADITLTTSHGTHPAVALRDAVRSLRAAGLPWPPPATWANLVVWTQRPPAAGATPKAAPRPRWTRKGETTRRADALFLKDTVPDAEDLLRPMPTFDPNRSGAVLTSDTLLAALRTARERYGHVPFTSMEFLTAVIATDTDDWATFRRAAGLDDLPAPVPGDDGGAPKGTTLTLGSGATYDLDEPLAHAYVMGKRLAGYRGDSELQPAHIVYGLFHRQDSTAARWLTSGNATTPAALRALLGERLLPGTLPAFADLPPAPALPPPKQEKVPIGTVHLHARLEVDPALVRVVRAAAAGQDGRSLTTTDLARAAVRLDPAAAAALGVPTAADAPDGASAAEADMEEGPGTAPAVGVSDGADPPTAGPRYGGRGLTVSDDCTVTASTRTIQAFHVGQRLSFQSGGHQLTAAHVLAALFAVDCDGARWLRGQAGASAPDSYPAAVSALFGGAEAADPDTKAPEEDWVLGPVRDILVLLAIGITEVLGWCGKRAVKFVTGVSILLVLGVTAALHSAATAQANVQLLQHQAGTIEGTLHTPDGKGHRAVLVSSLAAYYQPPVVTGRANSIKAALRPNTPRSLGDWYAFAVPADPTGRMRSGPATLNYKHRTTPAQLHCDGLLGGMACIAEAKLTGSASPGGFKWWLPGKLDFDASRSRASALLLSREKTTLAIDGGTVRLRDVPAQYADSGLLTVTDDDESAVPPLSPVILNGSSDELPLLGFSLPSTTAHEADVLPVSFVISYVSRLADDRAGSVPGATAAAGVITAEKGPASARVVVLSPLAGGRADVSGVKDGDILVTVDGHTGTTSAGFKAIVTAHHPGDTLRLTVRRSGHLVRIDIRLSYKPR